jgi:cystathionine beta-lyase/cystathionine gamma-synthase
MEENLSTRCVHAGEIKDAQGAPHTPIYSTSTFGFEKTADLLDVIEGRRDGNLYTRYGLNPTIKSLEAKLASLESAEAALAFCSGMAAEAALFFTHGRSGIVCIGDAYGGTLQLLGEQLPQVGISTHLILGIDVPRLEEILANGPKLIFLETPTNPTLEILNIRRIAEAAHRHGSLLAVDNTFATPVNQQPLALGADFVVHSATKYLGGHSDITAGAIMASQRLINPIGAWRKNLGQILAPETAALLARSIRTLVVRVRQQSETAAAVARAMGEQAKVVRVLYPGLPDFPGYALAKAQMSGFGGMLTLELKGSFQDAAAAVDRLKVFTIAPSLGGAESLVTQPVTTTHHGLTPEERRRRGISDTMLRLSMGLEAAEDLIQDLQQALSV